MLARACNHERWTADCHECGAPPPVVPPIGRCVAREVEAGGARLRAVSEIPAILARTPSAVDVLRALAESYEYDRAHAQERAAAVGTGETQREHEQHAAELGAVAEVLRVVLSLVPHTPTVAADAKERNQ